MSRYVPGAPAMWSPSDVCGPHGVEWCLCEEYERYRDTPNASDYRVNEDGTVRAATDEEMYGKEFVERRHAAAQLALKNRVLENLTLKEFIELRDHILKLLPAQVEKLTDTLASRRNWTSKELSTLTRGELVRNC
ncbi:MAG TPA: hypothetical protein VFB79_23855 [Candidatus Angelobacter sp.]|nr:hypothetical protein [Candidatus Angelobacter sp.]